MVLSLICNHVAAFHHPTQQDQPRAQVFHQEDTHNMENMVQAI